MPQAIMKQAVSTKSTLSQHKTISILEKKSNECKTVKLWKKKLSFVGFEAMLKTFCAARLRKSKGFPPPFAGVFQLSYQKSVINHPIQLWGRDYFFVIRTDFWPLFLIWNGIFRFFQLFPPKTVKKKLFSVIRACTHDLKQNEA